MLAHLRHPYPRPTRPQLPPKRDVRAAVISMGAGPRLLAPRQTYLAPNNCNRSGGPRWVERKNRFACELFRAKPKRIPPLAHTPRSAPRHGQPAQEFPPLKAGRSLNRLWSRYTGPMNLQALPHRPCWFRPVLDSLCGFGRLAERLDSNPGTKQTNSMGR
jgi:hypothetical protein